MLCSAGVLSLIDLLNSIKMTLSSLCVLCMQKIPLYNKPKLMDKLKYLTGSCDITQGQNIVCLNLVESCILLMNKQILSIFI